MKEIYIPASLSGFASNSVCSVSSQCVFYFTGTTEQEAKDFQANTSSTENTILKKATIKSLAEFNALTEKSGSYLVYGYSACDAFYNGAHIEADTVNGSACYLKDCSRCDVGELYIGGDINSGTHTLAVEYVYANGYMQAGQIVSICSNPGCTHRTAETAFTEELAPVFKSLEYSVAEEGFGICVNYKVNKDALAVYKNSGKSISFGVVAIMANNVENNGPLANDGTVATEKKVIAADVTADNIRAVTLRISGDESTWKSHAAEAIYILGYATNGTNLEYLGSASDTPAERNNITSVKSLVIGNFFNFN